MSKSYEFLEAVETETGRAAVNLINEEVGDWAARGYNVESWSFVPPTEQCNGFYIVLMSIEGKEEHSRDEG